MLAEAMVESEKLSRVRRGGVWRVKNLVHANACKGTMVLSKRRMIWCKRRTVCCKEVEENKSRRQERKERWGVVHQ